MFFDLSDILDNDVETDIVAAAGSQDLGIAVRLGHIGPFILDTPHRHRQSAVMQIVRPIIKLLECLGIKHPHQVIHTGVVVRDHTENRPFPLTQAAQIQLVPAGHAGNLGQVESCQSYSSADNDAFGCLSRNELSRTFYQKNKQQYYLLHYACCVCHLAV